MWHAIKLSVFVIAIAYAKDCSTWLHPSEDGQCVCGSTLGTVVVCNNKTQEVAVLSSYCLTSYEDGSNTSVAGRCFVIFKPWVKPLNPAGIYDRVSPKIADQDEKTCGSLNRQGRLCSQCKPNHSVSAYSYDLKCYPCTSSLWRNTMLYICIAYLPLTVFLCVVVVFHISVTSPAMNVPVLYCQILSAPFVLRVLLEYITNENELHYTQALASIYGLWNLDFFRTVIPPICLQLNTMQMIALDYLVALYPLLLLVCFYVLVTAHDRGYRLIVRLCRPFLWCAARLRQQWNIRSTIIDSFATFFILTNIKLLNTSMDLLTSTYIDDEYGIYVGSFLYNDATIRFLSPEHMPYAILAISVFLVGISPLILMVLYPMLLFQKFLNRFHLNRPCLQMFMQSFQGYYRDRTDGGKECRYFAALYPAFRIFLYFLYCITLSNMFHLAFILLCILVVVVILIVQPYNNKYKLYNKLDIIMFLSLVFLTIGNIEIVIAFDEKQISKKYGSIIVGIFCLTPLIYCVVKFILLLRRPRLSRRYHLAIPLDNHVKYKKLSADEEPISVNKLNV